MPFLGARAFLFQREKEKKGRGIERVKSGLRLGEKCPSLIYQGPTVIYKFATLSCFSPQRSEPFFQKSGPRTFPTLCTKKVQTFFSKKFGPRTQNFLRTQMVQSFLLTVGSFLKRSGLFQRVSDLEGQIPTFFSPKKICFCSTRL